MGVGKVYLDLYRYLNKHRIHGYDNMLALGRIPTRLRKCVPFQGCAGQPARLSYFRYELARTIYGPSDALLLITRLY